MKYLSLFSGIGTAEKGIEQAYDNHYQYESTNVEAESRRNGTTDINGNSIRLADQSAFRRNADCIGFAEIDRFAASIYKYHWPDVRNYGDATGIVCDELPDFDFLVGGFPCQSFSIAGKRQGFNEARGTLFFEIARILSHKRPRHFLLENVKGLLSSDDGKVYTTILRILSDLDYRVETVVLNSKHYGVPQNRERVFFIGHSRNECCGEILSFGESNEFLDATDERESGRSVCSTVRPGMSGLPGNSETYISTNASDNGIMQLNDPTHSNNRVYSQGGARPALNTAQGGNRQPFVAIPVLTPDRPTKRQNGRRMKEQGEASFTLTAQDRHGVMLYSDRITETDTAGTLKSRNDSGRGENHAQTGVLTDRRIRRLTPTECERLQGLLETVFSGTIEICLDHQKNSVYAETLNPKLPKPALNVESDDYPETVFPAVPSSPISSPPINKPALPDVLIKCGLNGVEILNSRGRSLYASSAAANEKCHPHGLVEGFALILAGINTTLEQITRVGGEASLLNGQCSITGQSGERFVKLSGSEITQLVSDALTNSTTPKEPLKSITLNLSDSRTTDQTLTTLFSFVVRAIAGFIPEKTLTENLLRIEYQVSHGHTKYGIDAKGHVYEVSDSQRYKTLGNAMTVNVIEAIVTRMISKGCL